MRICAGAARETRYKIWHDFLFADAFQVYLVSTSPAADKSDGVVVVLDGSLDEAESPALPQEGPSSSAAAPQQPHVASLLVHSSLASPSPSSQGPYAEAGDAGGMTLGQHGVQDVRTAAAFTIVGQGSGSTSTSWGAMGEVPFTGLHFIPTAATTYQPSRAPKRASIALQCSGDGKACKRQRMSASDRRGSVVGEASPGRAPLSPHAGPIYRRASDTAAGQMEYLSDESDEDDDEAADGRDRQRKRDVKYIDLKFLEDGGYFDQPIQVTVLQATQGFCDARH